jgi:benzylsuccinate CoA-transferase BbsE subunit
VGPFYEDMPNRERSLYFWHYNTSKRGITLDVETEDGRQLFRKLAEGADVILETFDPGYMASLGLGYDDLKESNPGLIMCSLTSFGQTGPWKDYVGNDLLHLAAGGQMACCGYSDEDLPGAPPIAPGGGQAWHTGSHFACMGIISALMHRTQTGKGQYIDTSVHESCALTTEMHVNTWIYGKAVVQRQTGRHAAAQPNQKSQHMCGDGKFVNVGAQIVTRITGEQLKVLRGWYEELGLPVDLIDEKERNPDVITDNELFMMLLASASRDQIYHGGQKRGFNLGAVRAPDEVMEDPHLEDRGFWTAVEQPQVGKSFLHPGPAGIFNGSPWRISRRAPMIGEHNEELLCGELGLSRAELAVLAESGVV